MFTDTVALTDDLSDLVLDGELIATEFRDRYGCYRVGHVEDDPEMVEYEQIVELGLTISRGLCR